MFCPRCGQQQAAYNIKFCSRCGFPLGLVSEILSHGGFLPQLADAFKSKKKLTKRNGKIFSLFWFLFFVLILTPFFGILDIDELAGMSAIFGVFGALILFLASVFFLDNPPKNFLGQIPNDSENFGLNAAAMGTLPPPTAGSAQEYISPGANLWKTPDTNDLVQPHSVTDSTTKLLQKEE